MVEKNQLWLGWTGGCGPLMGPLGHGSNCQLLLQFQRNFVISNHVIVHLVDVNLFLHNKGSSS